MGRSVSKVHVTSEFERAFHKLPSNIRSLAEKKYMWFRQDAFDPRIHTHKLKGELKGYWAYSVNREYRILFRFLKNNEVIYYDIGTHEIYK